MHVGARGHARQREEQKSSTPVSVAPEAPQVSTTVHPRPNHNLYAPRITPGFWHGWLRHMLHLDSPQRIQARVVRDGWREDNRHRSLCLPSTGDAAAGRAFTFAALNEFGQG